MKSKIMSKAAASLLTFEDGSPIAFRREHSSNMSLTRRNVFKKGDALFVSATGKISRWVSKTRSMSRKNWQRNGDFQCLFFRLLLPPFRNGMFNVCRKNVSFWQKKKNSLEMTT